MDRLSVIKAMQIEKELAVRKRQNRLKDYNSGEKVHLKQMQFHKCEKRNRWVFGGNRSGKTECGAVEAIWWVRGIHPYRENRNNVCGFVVSLSYEVQREVAQSKILHYLDPSWIEDIVMLSGRKDSPEYGVIDHIVVRNVLGGLSRLVFKSVDQGREKFQGSSLDFVWFDEEPPQDIYDECRMRVLDRRGEIWGTMTPLKGLSWVYEEIFLNVTQNPEIWHIHIEWADNPFLDKSEVALLNNTMSAESVESRRYGRFSTDSGLVYTEFDENIHVIEPFDIPLEWQDNISIDPGLNNPLACLFFGCDYDSNVYVVGEHYEAGRDIDYHVMQINELADKLNWHRDSCGRLCSLIDSAASQRTLAGTRSVSELFYDKGIAVNTKVNKELFTGIARVKEYLSARPAKLMIFSTCKNLIREIKGYWWSKGDTPRKRDDHALDALRYYIMSRPVAAKPENKQISDIQNDKLALIRRAKLRGRYEKRQ